MTRSTALGLQNGSNTMLGPKQGSFEPNNNVIKLSTLSHMPDMANTDKKILMIVSTNNLCKLRKVMAFAFADPQTTEKNKQTPTVNNL